MPNGKLVNLDGVTPESVTNAANEMYERVRLKIMKKLETRKPITY